MNEEAQRKMMGVIEQLDGKLLDELRAVLLCPHGKDILAHARSLMAYDPDKHTYEELDKILKAQLSIMHELRQILRCPEGKDVMAYARALMAHFYRTTAEPWVNKPVL